MLGARHKAILDWLVNDWTSNDRRICVVEGFSGVGKTEIAYELERRTSVAARIDAPESGDLDDLLLALSEQLAASGNLGLANTVAAGQSVEVAFEALLMQPVQIVIDEFQRMLDKSNAAPTAPVAALLERISKRATPGRLLLLSHHALDKTMRWGERVVFKTLDGLSPLEGSELLRTLLEQRGREADIPSVRRADISRWLGGNPRALRVLVGCLDQEALDQLTGVVPEAWEARDQEVSASLIARLERELLLRALENLDGASATALAGISVYRKATDREGITRLLSPGLRFEDFIGALSSRFLIEQRTGRYLLNPVVREISLYRLKVDSSASKTAHRLAAGHYTRHFTARQIVNAERLGGAFIEARYHLVQADEIQVLAPIAMRFGDHLQSLYGWISPSAVNETQRDEVIAVLSAYLQDGGPKAMNYYLARLLSERRREGDVLRALDHARRSTGAQSQAAAWVLRLRLEFESEGVESMLKAAREGYRAVPPDENLFSVYRMAADILAASGHTSVAMDQLEEGIENIPPDKGLYSLYLAEADLLHMTGQIGDAILILRQGLTVVPASDASPLYKHAAQLLKVRGDISLAIELLREGLRLVPPDKNLSSIYVVLSEMLADADQFPEAEGILEEGLLKISTDNGRSWIQAKLLEIRGVKRSGTPATLDGKLSDPTASGSGGVNATATSEEAPAATMKKAGVGILAIGTEWDSRHGGLSTFNRDLCIELAAAGHRVVCLVPSSSVEEVAQALQFGVHLVSPAAAHGLSGPERLLVDIPMPEGFSPDLIIGHDRKTGPHARARSQKLAQSKFVLFVHTRPENIEWYKDGAGSDDASTTAEERRLLLEELACSAELVVGVGPDLARSAATLVHLADPKPLVHQLVPGLRTVKGPSGLPPEYQCLLLGRAEDMRLKGLDIAARSVGQVSRREKVTLRPRLIVRGAPVGEGAKLRQQLAALGGTRLIVEVRDYSPNVERLQQDILRASLVLMPSRSEGFGLVALEAVAAGIPILVSDQSGFATFLSERIGKDAQQFIVETQEDLVESANEWERSIENVLADRESAFARADRLRLRLSDILVWPDVIGKLEAAWQPLLTARG